MKHYCMLPMNVTASDVRTSLRAAAVLRWYE